MRSDARADLLYVCALLVACGVEAIAGVDLRRRAEKLLTELEPDEVEGFFSYRVAEAVDLLGGLQTLSPHARDQAIAATESPRLVRDIVAGIRTRRPNFTVVAARCLHARRRLGLDVDAAQEAIVLERARRLFDGSPTGWINDGRAGEVHLDIYTPEMYLLAEPLRDTIGQSWDTGLTSVLADLEVLMQPDGAIAWGRSIGALALAMTLELSVLAELHGIQVNHRGWRGAGLKALHDLHDWFDRGVVTAHGSRTCDPYRGPARRLQLTFDLLSKVGWCALHERQLSAEPRSALIEAPVAVDELRRLQGGACAWTHRSAGLAFVLPLMGGRTPPYVPSPRAHGLFEQPVTGFPLAVPTISVASGSNERRYVPWGLPAYVEHRPGALTVHQCGWVALQEPGESLGGRRTVEYRVAGRRLDVTEDIAIDAPPPGAIMSVAVGELPAQNIQFACGVGGPPTTVDTVGMEEWRTHSSEVQRVHQAAVALESPSRLRFRWSVTRALRVATTEPTHQYSRSLYDCMPQVSISPSGPPDDDLVWRLRTVDVLHLAWPERWIGVDSRRTERAIEHIRASGTKIVWTQHNLLPHKDRSPEARRTYRLWAEAADAVIHHTTYGKLRALQSYEYPNADHFVLRHGHWGRWFPDPRPARSEVESEECWPATHIRLAIVGRPRHDKQLQRALDAFSRTSRDDIQLVARVSAGLHVPDDPRIITSYGSVDRRRYYRRLSAVDGLLMPFTGETMVTTGTAFDAIGGGLGVIASPWGFLEETFRSAALWYDGTEHALVELLEGLSLARLQLAGAASAALQELHDWATIGPEVAAVFDRITTDEPSCSTECR